MSFSYRFFRFIRKHARPIEPNKAVRWKNRLNALYIFFAWNAVGLIIYYHAFGKGKDVPLPDSSGEAWARFLKMPNTVHIVKMKGFTAVESYEYVVPKKVKPEETEPQQDSDVLPR